MSPEDRVAQLETEVRQLRAQLAERRHGPEGDTVAFLTTVLEAVPAFILRVDADLRLQYINRVQPGLTREGVIGTHVWELASDGGQDAVRRCIENVVATGIADTIDTPGFGAYGSTALYELFVAPVEEAGGRRGACIVAVDMTAARRRERALRESDEKLRLAASATGIGLWSWSVRTGEVIWDARMREIAGRDTPMDLPTYIAQLVHPEDRKRIAASSERPLDAGAWEAPPHRLLRPDGSVRWVLVRGMNIVGEDGKLERIVGGTLDITEQRTLEDQLRHSQRLDALGHLTAGVAHNFNNLLTVIMSSLDLLSRRLPSGSTAMIEDAMLAARRAAEMVRELMTFAGQRPRAARRSHAIQPIVEHAIAICRRTFERHIVIEHTAHPDLPPVVCSEGELEQILMNLLLNARDAVLASGRPAPRVVVTADLAAPPGHAAPFVRIRVQDDGVGMTADVAGRAFDPFFTTKPPGKGTGLGLATSYAIARELGGVLTCSSSPGVGATFDLFLPAGKPASAPPVDVEPPALQNQGRVLLVDDEDPIRRAVAAVLSDAGFEVEGAASGAEALVRLGAAPPVDVVLLDRSMPGAPGETFLGRMRALSPATRIVLFSGQVVEPALAAQVDDVIVKPAASRELIAKVSQLVAAGPRKPAET